MLKVNVAALVLALTASLLLLVVPVYSSVGGSAVVDGSGENQSITMESSKTTLLEENGRAVLMVLSVPVLITLTPLLTRGRSHRRAWLLASAITLTVLCVLAGFSIGLLYLPAAVALWIATALSGRADWSARSSEDR